MRDERHNITLYGIGLCLYTINNTALSLSLNGAVIIWLPWIGIIMMLIALTRTIGQHPIKTINDALSTDRFNRWYVLSCLVLALCMLISIRGTDLHVWGERCFVLAFACGGWLMGRRYGLPLFLPFIAFSVVVAVSVFAYCLATGWDDTGGIVSATNYDLAVAVLAMGTVFAMYGMDQWPNQKRILAIVILVIAVGLNATMAAEALVALAALMVIMALHNRWLLAGSVACIMIAGWLIQTSISERTQEVQQSIAAWGEGRVPAIKQAMHNASSWGYGFSINEYRLPSGGIIAHNQLAAVLQQSGALAAGAWLTTILTGLRYRYWGIVAMIVALGLFDHLIWTALSPVWWAAMGAIAIEKYEEVPHDIQERKVAVDHIMEGC